MKNFFKILLSYCLAFQPAFAALNDVEKAQTGKTQILPNPGFENGLSSITATDLTDVAHVTSGTNLLDGKGSITWNSDGASQTLTFCATVPEGYEGRNGAAGFKMILTPSGTATHTIKVTDGTSDLVSAETITSSTSPQSAIRNFIFSTTGTACIVLSSVAADEPLIAIDNGFMGLASDYNVSSVSQATFVGGMENAGASTCAYAETTSTGASDFVDLGTGTSCAAWTVVSNGPGTISAQGTNDHRLVYTNMPPGNYKFELSGIFQQGNISGACTFRLSDGTTTYQPQAMGVTTTVEVYVPLLSFHVTVTTAGTRTYKLQAADSMASSGCVWLNSANYNASWKVYRFPTSSEQAYTPDLQAMSWSGYHDSTCVWSRTNTAFGDFTADATCALTERTNSNFGTVSASGSVLPAITFTPKKTGRYYVCAIANAISGGTTSNTWALQLIDGASTVVSQATGYTPANGAYQASMCGIYVVTSLSAKTLTIQAKVSSSSIAINGGAVGSSVEWSIVSIDQSLPAPVLTNMVTASASGGLRIVRGKVNYSGTVPYMELGGEGISSVSDGGTGITGLNFVAGTFSAIPSCTGDVLSASGTPGLRINTDYGPSTSAVGFTTFSGGVNADLAYFFTCVGPK